MSLFLSRDVFEELFSPERFTVRQDEQTPVTGLPFISSEPRALADGIGQRADERSVPSDLAWYDGRSPE